MENFNNQPEQNFSITYLCISILFYHTLVHSPLSLPKTFSDLLFSSAGPPWPSIFPPLHLQSLHPLPLINAAPLRHNLPSSHLRVIRFHSTSRRSRHAFFVIVMERSPQLEPRTATKLTQTTGYVHTSMVTYCSVTQYPLYISTLKLTGIWLQIGQLPNDESVAIHPSTHPSIHP